MPSLGFCLLVAVGARRLAAACPKVSAAFKIDREMRIDFQFQGVMQLLTAVMACLVLVTAAKTFIRNEVRKSPQLIVLLSCCSPGCSELELRSGTLHSGCKGQSEQCKVAQ